MRGERDGDRDREYSDRERQRQTQTQTDRQIDRQSQSLLLKVGDLNASSKSIVQNQTPCM